MRSAGRLAGERALLAVTVRPALIPYPGLLSLHLKTPVAHILCQESSIRLPEPRTPARFPPPPC